MPRIARVVILEYPHHITQRGTNRMAIFIDEKDKKIFLNYLWEAVKKSKTKVLAYCLMSNHFHLLIIPEDTEGLCKCLHWITFRYAQYFNKKYNRSGRLWENRYFSCPIDRDEYLWNVMRYIEMNPVRAGTTKKAEDWKWSSAKAHVKGKEDRFGLEKWFNEKEREEYSEYLVEEKKIEEIRKSTSTGRPLGGEQFYDRLKKELNINLKPQKGGRPRKPK